MALLNIGPFLNLGERYPLQGGAAGKLLLTRPLFEAGYFRKELNYYESEGCDSLRGGPETGYS